jgi:hypothetical protein
MLLPVFTRYPFIARHRGGPLTPENHRKLIRWARECSEHVVSLVGGIIDRRLSHALLVAEEWEKGQTPTGSAMMASRNAHAAAREAAAPVEQTVARSIGHAVATAHMADHSIGAALYALKAVRLAGKSVDRERKWQIERLRQLPPELMETVITTMAMKEKPLGVVARHSLTRSPNGARK